MVAVKIVRELSLPFVKSCGRTYDSVFFFTAGDAEGAQGTQGELKALIGAFGNECMTRVVQSSTGEFHHAHCRRQQFPLKAVPCVPCVSPASPAVKAPGSARIHRKTQ